MAGLDDLKQVLKETLDARGALGEIRARVRAEVFHALEEEEIPKAPLSNENIVINDLIREYFEFNKYKHALSVMMPETGQPAVPLNRAFLAQELGVVEDSTSRQVPLLYAIVSRLQDARRLGVHQPAQQPTHGEQLGDSLTAGERAPTRGFTAAAVEAHEPRPLILRQ
mmetsp:Transcript_73007/g.171623  ORF Transcript_73007/g.171623 Transcript_73007/m.171623 type:complete len:168 (+) Transcript_73007:1-504(+)